MTVFKTLTERINLSIEPEVKAYFSELATLRGETMSEYIRYVMREHMRRTMIEPLVGHHFNVLHSQEYGVVHVGGTTYPYRLIEPLKEGELHVIVTSMTNGLLEVVPVRL